MYVKNAEINAFLSGEELGIKEARIHLDRNGTIFMERKYWTAREMECTVKEEVQVAKADLDKWSAFLTALTDQLQVVNSTLAKANTTGWRIETYLEMSAGQIENIPAVKVEVPEFKAPEEAVKYILDQLETYIKDSENADR